MTFLKTEHQSDAMLVNASFDAMESFASLDVLPFQQEGRERRELVGGGPGRTFRMSVTVLKSALLVSMVILTAVAGLAPIWVCVCFSLAV